jgi:MscS family membrane protein
VTGVAVGVQRFWLPRGTEEMLWLGIKLAFIAALLWLTWSVVSLVAQGLGWLLKRTYREPDQQTVAVIRRSLHLIQLVIFAIIVAEVIFGVQIESVLIGVGLLGLAVTLAAQDSLKNLFGSLTIVFDRPFKVGDLIDFKGYFGTVEDIGFRSTKVREFDGHLVTIPNAEIVREAVQNIGARPWIRRRFRIGLRYDADADQVKKAIAILNDVLSGRDDEPDEMGTHVVFEGFGESTLNLLVQYCVEPGEYWDALERGSELNLEIVNRFNEAGIEFAFPTRTAVLETDDGRMPAIAAHGATGDET